MFMPIFGIFTSKISGVPFSCRIFNFKEIPSWIHLICISSHNIHIFARFFHFFLVFIRFYDINSPFAYLLEENKNLFNKSWNILNYTQCILYKLNPRTKKPDNYEVCGKKILIIQISPICHKLLLLFDKVFNKNIPKFVLHRVTFFEWKFHPKFDFFFFLTYTKYLRFFSCSGTLFQLTIFIIQFVYKHSLTNTVTKT